MNHRINQLNNHVFIVSRIYIFISILKIVFIKLNQKNIFITTNHDDFSFIYLVMPHHWPIYHIQGKLQSIELEQSRTDHPPLKTRQGNSEGTSKSLLLKFN